MDIRNYFAFFFSSKISFFSYSVKTMVPEYPTFVDFWICEGLLSENDWKDFAEKLYFVKSFIFNNLRFPTNFLYHNVLFNIHIF